MILIGLTTDKGQYSLTAQPIQEGIELRVTGIDGTEIFNQVVVHVGNHLRNVSNEIGKISEFDITIERWKIRSAEEKSNLESILRFLLNQLN